MADIPNENLDQTPENPSAEEVFAGDLNLTPSAEDIFVGGKELDRSFEGQSSGGVFPDHSVTYQVQGPAGSAGGEKKLSLTHVMLGVLTIAVIVLMFRQPQQAVVQYMPPPEGLIGPNTVEIEQDDTEKAETVKQSVVENIAEPDKISDTSDDEFYFDVPLSWSLAHSLFTEKQYRKAHYVYKRLAESLRVDDPQQDVLKDVLNLQMALCLYLDGRSEDLASLLTVVLDSRSPSVRALANYYLAFIDFRGKRYLSARSRAYRTLATLEIVKDLFPETMESDCYFLMANAITCEVNRLNNSDAVLPGKFWSDTLRPYFLPEMNARQLGVFLNRGIATLGSANLEPVVQTRKGITVGAKYSVIANESAVDEVIAKFAAISENEINWSTNSLSHKHLPVTMVMTKASGQEIPEIALGCLGLIARFDSTAIGVHNVKMENSLKKQKEILTAEAISAWQRFLLRYRGDYRSANAHFGLAMMRAYCEMYDVAIGEYKIILSRYARNSLAPFALLNSSRIKTKLGDYINAQKYLKQLVLEYPNARFVDQAYLYLAKANLSIRLYPEAFNLFKKVYHINLAGSGKAEAAYGAAVCKYYLNDYKSSEEWFNKCFKSLTNPPGIDVYKAYYFLARTRFNLGKYSDAVSAFKYALAGDLTKEEFSKIVIEITETLVEKGEIIEAANLIENIPESSLQPRLQCEVVIARARIFTAMNLPGNGISLLKQKIEFMADYQLRSKLMLELGRCYLAAGEFEKAYDEIAAAITEMPVGELLMTANNEFAEICLKLGKDQEAVEICLGVLNSPNTKATRNQTCRILGRAYKKQKKYGKAAEAFAGIFDKSEVSKNE